MKTMRIEFAFTPQNVEEVIAAANDMVGVMVKEFSFRTLSLITSNSVALADVADRLNEVADLRTSRDVRDVTYN